MPPLSRRAVMLLVLLTIGVATLFSGSFHHYFQGDSLYWLSERYTSLGKVAEAFLSVDSYGYFRPLSHPLIPSLFFPLFGLQPWGYHWVVFLIFLLTVWMAFVFFRALLGNDWEACLATFFFGAHSVNVFITFDFAFEPELLYGFFYLLSAFCFLGWLRTGRRLWSLLSFASLFVSLLCKEAAVTLPFNLFLIALFTRERVPETRSPFNALTAVAPHLALVAAYLLYLFFGLRGGRLLLGAASFDAGPSSLAPTVLANLGLALPWAMNLPAGWQSSWRHLPPILEWFLLFFAAAAIAGLLASILRSDPRKKLIQLGFLWFLVALAPMLTLTDFKAYYLYVPLMGLGLAVARVFALAWRSTPIRLAWLSNVVMGFIVALLWLSCHMIVAGDLANHPLLGGGSGISRRMAEGMQGIRPALPKGATILVLDTPTHPLFWHCAGGRLFRLLYRDPSLRALFATIGDRVSLSEMSADGFTAVAYREGGLEDVTEELRRSPDSMMVSEIAYVNQVRDVIQVSPSLVLRGEGRYTLRVAGAAERDVEIQFRVDGGPFGYFKANLNPRGEITFFVSNDNRRGLYEFVAFRLEGGAWTKSDPAAKLEVR